MQRARILLADDHPEVARQLPALLETEFDVIAIVKDGKALLSMADGM